MTTRRPDAPTSTMQEDEAPPASGLSSMQRAILTIQKMRTKIETIERARTEPIAIIGMACRLPGEANSPEAFFKILENGVDAVTEVPPERWPIGVEESADPVARAMRYGAFLKDVDLFDAGFFGISPREAAKMDPQQRLLLEVTWEALERAGQLPERLVNSRTGVFLGIMTNDYAELSSLAGAETEDAYTTTGNGHCFPAGRISYTFGFQGPSVAIDTACSSSLVALHLACQSLRNGESNLAVTGGVNLMLVPSTTRKYAKLSALSAEGRCKTFDAAANGFVRGEGCGMLVLKRLSDAERDGDTILALIRGSAVNQDGRSTGLTTPNVLAQQAMLRQALENARVAASDISYVEAHGTGTPLGDPIEVEALKAVLGGPREKGASCVLGAVKTNIGHLEAAAGVAGVMKVVLAIQNEKIPGNLHFRALNPRIDFKGTTLEIARTALPWKPGMRPRFAGVSSFGLSGTNAHVVLEEAPRNLEEPIVRDASAYLLPISAKTKEALAAHIEAYKRMLLSPDSPRLLDIVYTASSRRSHFEHRFAAVGGSKEELARALDSYSRGEMPAGVAQGKAAPARAKVVFVFSGQGSQWVGMGKKLYDEESAFRSVIDSCDTLLMGRLGWSLLDELDAAEHVSRIAETQVAQPLIFAIQIALVELLRSWGISPDAVIGHSVGEIAAAYIAGILSLDEAIRLVAIRGRIMQKATGLGKMVAVSMSEEEARKAIAGYQGRLSIAAINDPGSVVLSGEDVAIEELQAKLESNGVVCRPLRVNYAFQSPQMEPFAAELVERLARVDARRATLAMYSTVLRECVDGKELDVRYWGRNIREPVNLAGAVEAAIHDGYQLFLEVGPHPELYESVSRCLAARKVDGLAVPSLERGVDDRRAIFRAATGLYTRGCALEWPRLAPVGGKCVAVPSYPFRRERYWVELAERKTATARREKVVFVCPGQGSQWLGMGRALLASEPAFRRAIETCDSAIQNESGFSLLRELAASEADSRLHEIDVVQPVLFAIEVAIAALFRARGITPDCLVGHSMGEVAAAHIAGILSIEDAAKIICRRSRLLRRISGNGAMALVELSIEEAGRALMGYEERLAVAVSNGPRATVIAGDPEALGALLLTLEKQGVYCKRVKVDVASHSPQVDPLTDDLLRELRDLRPNAGTIPLFSTVLGDVAQGETLKAPYWVRNLRAPVLFSQVTRKLINDGYRVFVELSPHPILLPSIEENFRDLGQKGVVLAPMRRDTDEERSFSDALATLRAHEGVAKRREMDEPHGHSRILGSPHRPLLGAKFRPMSPPRATYWEGSLALLDFPWLAGHRVQDMVVFPGAGYIEMALEAAVEVLGDVAAVFENLAFDRMMVLPADGSRSVQVGASENADGSIALMIGSRGPDDEQWTQHASVRASARTDWSAGDVLIASERRLNGPARELLASSFYAEMRARGIFYEGAFLGVSEMRIGEDEVSGIVRLPSMISIGEYRAHPALLDACFQIAAALLPSAERAQTYVPASIARMTLLKALPREVSVYARRAAREPVASDAIELDVFLADRDGRPLGEVLGLRLQALEAPAANDPLQDCAMQVQWRKSALSAASTPRKQTLPYLLFVDEVGVAQSILSQLRERGERCIEVRRGPQFERTGTDSYRLDATDPSQLGRLLEESCGKQGCAGILHLAAIGMTIKEPFASDALEADLRASALSAVRIAQTVLKRGFRDVPRLWLLSQSAQAVVGTEAHIAIPQSFLWGLGRVIAMEHPELACTRMDLPLPFTQTAAQQVVAEILSGEEDQVAFRAHERYVARLGRARIGMAKAPIIRSDATYLITGGLGGLGLSVAQWLAERGAKHIALVSRSGPKEQTSAAISAMSGAGIDVRCFRADISQRADVEKLLKDVSGAMPALRGIIHAAVAIDDHTLLELDEARFFTPIRAKVFGALLLHELTAAVPLDFFVLYSSAAGILGTLGQASYAGANACVDALSHARVRMGLPSVSIQWGAFSDVGLAAADKKRGERLESRGIGSLSPSEGTTLLGRVLAAPVAELSLMRFSARQWLESYPQAATSAFWSELLEEGAGKSVSKEAKGAFAKTLLAAPGSERLATLERHIRELLGQVLRKAPDRIGSSEPFTAMGVDSLMSLELRNRLEASLGILLRATLLYTYPTTQKLAEYVLKDLVVEHEKNAEPIAHDGEQCATATHEAEGASSASERPESGAEDDDLLAAFDATVRDLK